MGKTTWNFFDEKDNVYTNVMPPKNGSPHLFERTSLANMLHLMSEWPKFGQYKYFLIDSRNPHRFELDKDSVVFYLSNEDHAVPEYLKEARVVFTSYYPYSPPFDHIHSIPLGVNGAVPYVEGKPYHEREVDVFFSGNLNKQRVPFYLYAFLLKMRNQIKKVRGKKSLNLFIRFTRSFASGLSPEQYGKMLANTKIALIPSGYDSSVSFRFFEAARAGCILITCRQPDVWHFRPFPGYYVTSWSELGKIVRELEKDPDKASRIQQEMLQYYEDYCSERSVANYVIKTIELTLHTHAYAE